MRLLTAPAVGKQPGTDCDIAVRPSSAARLDNVTTLPISCPLADDHCRRQRGRSTQRAAQKGKTRVRVVPAENAGNKQAWDAVQLQRLGPASSAASRSGREQDRDRGSTGSWGQSNVLAMAVAVAVAVAMATA